jgi:hypothetical protein
VVKEAFFDPRNLSGIYTFYCVVCLQLTLHSSRCGRNISFGTMSLGRK